MRNGHEYMSTVLRACFTFITTGYRDTGFVFLLFLCLHFRFMLHLFSNRYHRSHMVEDWQWVQCSKSCCPGIGSPSVIYANKAYTGQRCKTSYRLFGEHLQVFEHLALSEFEVSFSSRVHDIFLQIWQCYGNKY